MNTFLTAKEAKELAGVGREGMLNRILNIIKITAEKGGNSFEYWTDIKGEDEDFTKEESTLTELGYKVELTFSSANNEFKFLIKW